ncbi:hypothetical protein RhiirA4_453268 [Rhizophagus irregularis]|uniref:Uncharacterized protein n=1 Tax=Rhizophagus irregularis TaxID=588596 RepID=A0A2I1G056_9GLOM|nr:hypothetical protein RhiirA4_453268 [Rhizophagus irregularis]
MKSYQRDRIVIVCKGDIVSRQEVVQTSSQDPKIIRFVKKYCITPENCTSQDPKIIRFVKKYCIAPGNCTNLKSRSKDYTEIVQTSSQDPKIIRFVKKYCITPENCTSQDPKIIRFVKKYCIAPGNCTSQDQIIRFVKKYCVTSGNCTNLKSRSKNYTVCKKILCHVRKWYTLIDLMDAS